MLQNLVNNIGRTVYNTIGTQTGIIRELILDDATKRYNDVTNYRYRIEWPDELWSAPFVNDVVETGNGLRIYDPENTPHA